LSNALTIEIDVLALARKGLASEAAFNAITRAEVVALLGFVLQQNDESIDLLSIQFPDLFARMTAPALPATLAAAIAALMRAREALERAGDGSITAFEDAFTTLKTRFEKEFPHAGS
jgi:hypothetical protein